MSAMPAFAANPEVHWYRSPVDPAALTRLMERSNLRGALQTTAHLGCFFLTGAACYWLYL